MDSVKSLLCLLTLMPNVYGALTGRPLNTTIVIGSTLRVSCHSNLTTITNTITAIPVAWRYNGPISNNTTVTLFQSGSLQPPFNTLFRIDTESPYDLIADAANASYCGTYTCVDSNGSGEQATAIIQVSGSPLCNANVTSAERTENVTLVCDAPLLCQRGNADVVFWRNGQQFLTHDGILTLPASSFFESTWNCSIANDNTSLSKAECPKITQLVEPQNISIHPLKNIFHPGEALNCSADGNPQPTYQWTLLLNGTLVNESILNVTDNMVGFNFTFRCTATNYFNSQTHSISTDITFYVEQYLSISTAESTTDGLTSIRIAISSTGPLMPNGTSTLPRNSSNTAIIAGVVGGVGGAVILTLLIIVVVVLLRRKVKRTGEDKSSSSRPKQSDDIHLVSGEHERSSNDSNHNHHIPDGADENVLVASPGVTNKPINSRSPVGQYETVGLGHDVNENPDASPYAQPNNIAHVTPIVSNNNSDYAEVTTRKGPNAPAVPNPKPKPANSPTALYAPIDHNILTGNKN